MTDTFDSWLADFLIALAARGASSRLTSLYAEQSTSYNDTARRHWRDDATPDEAAEAEL